MCLGLSCLCPGHLKWHASNESKRKCFSVLSLSLFPALVHEAATDSPERIQSGSEPWNSQSHGNRLWWILEPVSDFPNNIGEMVKARKKLARWTVLGFTFPAKKYPAQWGTAELPMHFFINETKQASFANFWKEVTKAQSWSAQRRKVSTVSKSLEETSESTCVYVPPYFHHAVQMCPHILGIFQISRRVQETCIYVCMEVVSRFRIADVVPVLLLQQPHVLTRICPL